MTVHLAQYFDGYPLCWALDQSGPFEATRSEVAVTCPDCVKHLSTRAAMA